MGSFSKNFLILVSRLSITGVIVLGGFYFGSALNLAGITRETEKMPVKNLADKISESPVGKLELNIRPDKNSYSDEIKKTITPEIINNWLEPYQRNYSGKEDVRVSTEKIRAYLISLASSINTQPVNAKFVIVGGKVEEFAPSEYGRNLDIDASEALIRNAVINGAEGINLPLETVEPAITMEKANKLGITTLIGHGESDFSGSSLARAHNIKIGSVKYNGVIIKPGEDFSFNSILGKVDEQNGFESELVIKGGKLVKEAGGGLCQVSTTLFRSAIMAGLPILERRPHSFPVRYYNPQGFDATVYPGVADLKFKNDTLNHILIQSRIADTKLTFDIYGPDNGRKIALDGPHQYDQKSNGSMKAYFVRKITLSDGSSKEERFDSNYGAPLPLEKNPLE